MPKELNKEFEMALAYNLRVKTKILGITFTGIILIQLVGIFIVWNGSLLESEVIKKLFIAPLLLLIIVADQFMGYSHLTSMINGKRKLKVKKSFVYTLTLLESLMPTVIIAFAIIVIGTSKYVNADMILNSPPMIVYLFFIILSSLVLDFWLSATLGFFIGVQYACLVLWFMDYATDGYAMPIVLSKSVFFFVAGIIAGVVAKVIKRSVRESLKAKDTLINKLDERVKERTFELNEANEELEAQNNQLNMQNEEIMAQRDKIEAQKDLIERKHQEIHASIVYGKRIQNALLDSNDWDEIGRERFIFYKPKDIVSGDFYWSHIDNNLQIWVAADCTGHGIPGAFMSMLGIGFLNDIVVEEGEREPSQILNRLREKIIKALKQYHKTDFEQKDGMDMALCIFDKDNYTLKFSGANNPLVLIRNGNVEKVDPDRMPVGKYMAVETDFQTREVRLQKGDMLYTFSDGYSDEFGGSNRKKLGAKKFRELLQSISTFPAQKQHDELDKFMNNWLRNTEQIDDICIVGVRV